MKTRKIYHRSGAPDFPVSIGIEYPGKHLKIKPDASYHSEIEISMQVAGSSVNWIDGETITHQAGDIWIVPSETPHRRITYSEDSVIYWMVFLPDAIAMQPEHFFQKEFVKPLAERRLEMPFLLQPGHPCYESVRQGILQLKNCPFYEANYKQKRLQVLMQICLALMPYCQVDESVAVIPEAAPEGVKRCMRYIQNRYPQKLTLEQIAAYCYLHPNRLSAQFKQHTGESVFAYLTRFRVETAAGLLEREDLPVSKVAELVGFRSECLFYRKFKEIMGVSPKTYAKTTRNK